MNDNSPRSKAEELAYEPLDIAGWRRTLSSQVVAGVVACSYWLNRHWLMLANSFNTVLLAGTFAAPLLKAASWEGLAGPLYAFYSLICLQRPSHSFFVLGFEMGMEVRMVAIYAGFVVGGMAFVAWPTRAGTVLTRLTSWWAYLLLSLPLLLDVFSQTLGLRDSNWLWRSSTGFLFGLATTWYFYSRFKRVADHLRKQREENENEKGEYRRLDLTKKVESGLKND